MIYALSRYIIFLTFKNVIDSRLTRNTLKIGWVNICISQKEWGEMWNIIVQQLQLVSQVIIFRNQPITSIVRKTVVLSGLILWLFWTVLEIDKSIGYYTHNEKSLTLKLNLFGHIEKPPTKWFFAETHFVESLEERTNKRLRNNDLQLMQVSDYISYRKSKLVGSEKNIGIMFFKRGEHKVPPVWVDLTL